MSFSLDDKNQLGFVEGIVPKPSYLDLANKWINATLWLCHRSLILLIRACNLIWSSIPKLLMCGLTRVNLLQN